MTTINLASIWGSPLPPGGEFRRGDCEGNNAAGPVPNITTGEVTFTCDHAGSTFIYSYHVGEDPCDSCNTIQVTVHPQPCLEGENLSFCRIKSYQGTISTVRLTGPSVSVTNGVVTVPLTSYLENCCTGGSYPDPVQWRLNGGAWGSYNPPTVNLWAGNCESEINQSWTVGVRRSGGPTPCEDEAVISVCASPLFDTPNPDGGENCVADCSSVNLRNFIDYPGGDGCLLQPSAPQNTQVTFRIYHRAVNSSDPWVQISGISNWWPQSNVNLCTQINAGDGCREFRMEFEFEWSPTCVPGAQQVCDHSFNVEFTLCVDPPQLLPTPFAACNDVFNVN